MTPRKPKKQHYRAIFISDVHLGTPSCQAEHLCDFLDSHKCDRLYLIGDIVDGWRIKRGRMVWPQSHTNVIRKILSKAKNGVSVIWIPGNHDEFMRGWEEFGKMVFGNVSVQAETVHETAAGQRFLVTHGDLYDGIVRIHKWLSYLGDSAYSFLLWLNRYFNRFRKLLGLQYWSLAGFLKHQVKHAAVYIDSFERALARRCEDMDLDGVICGHIHHAVEGKPIGGVRYYNDGDWVESCTALVEDNDGALKLVRWVSIDHEDMV